MAKQRKAGGATLGRQLSQRTQSTRLQPSGPYYDAVPGRRQPPCPKPQFLQHSCQGFMYPCDKRKATH